MTKKKFEMTFDLDNQIQMAVLEAQLKLLKDVLVLAKIYGACSRLFIREIDKAIQDIGQAIFKLEIKMIKENQRKKGGNMTRKEFDRILIEEGILNKETRDDLWRTRPTDSLDEKRCRRASRAFKRLYPWACKEEV